MPASAFQRIFYRPPTDCARLVYQLIQMLAETTGIQQKHDAYRSLDACMGFQDLAKIDWPALECSLTTSATCSGKQVACILSAARLVTRWAILHHQLYLAKSSRTLLFSGHWRLPWYILPPELTPALQEVQRLMQNLDTALTRGRAAVTRFQSLMLQGAGAALHQAALAQARESLSLYRRAYHQVGEFLAMIAWYLDQVTIEPAGMVPSPAVTRTAPTLQR